MASIFPSFNIAEHVCIVPGMTFSTLEIIAQPGTLNKKRSPTVCMSFELNKNTFDMK